jgi:hypothetical protein
MPGHMNLLQGTLDMLILKAVSLGPLHSYGVLLRIQQISGDRLEMQQGSLCMVLREALLLVAVGSAIGLSAALASERLVTSQLFGVQVADQLSIAAASAVLLTVAGVARYLPARRASHVDPMVALHYE